MLESLMIIGTKKPTIVSPKFVSKLYASETAAGGRMVSCASNNNGSFCVGGYDTSNKYMVWVFDYIGGQYVQTAKFSLSVSGEQKLKYYGNKIYACSFTSSRVDVYGLNPNYVQGGGMQKWILEKSIYDSSLNSYLNQPKNVYVVGDYVFIQVEFDGGRVHVYKLENGSYVRKQTIVKNNSITAKYLHFDGTYLIFGHAYDSTKNTYSGVVYVYKLVDGVFVEHQLIYEPTPGYMHLFGNNVISIGNKEYLIVANYDNYADITKIYLYKQNQNGLLEYVSDKQYAGLISKNLALDAAVIDSTVVVNQPTFNSNAGAIRYLSVVNSTIVESIDSPIVASVPNQYFANEIETDQGRLIALDRGTVQRCEINIYA